MMKQLILLIMVLALLLLVAENQRTTIQVVIVLPPELVPYYEWLLSFPDWQQLEDDAPASQPILVTNL